MRRAFGWAGQAVGALVAASGVFGLLAGSVSPVGMWWWFQVFAVGLPLTMIAVGAGALLSLFLGRWRWAGVFVALLVLFGLQAEPWARLGRAEPADGDLLLLTFNVPRSGPSKEQLAQDVSALIQQAAPHVVALQEAMVLRGDDGVIYEPIQVAGAQDSLGFVLVRPFLGLGIPTQVPVLAQPDFQVIRSERIALPTAGDGYARGSEAMRLHFRWKEREAVLYNLHLRSFGARKPWKERRERLWDDTTWAGYADRYREAYQLRAVEAEALAGRVAQDTLPVLVSGDFNSTPANWSFRRLLRGRRDAQRVAGRAWWAPTYPAQSPAVRIDAVLVSADFDIVSVDVLPAEFSDHRPVLVRLRWREE